MHPNSGVSPPTSTQRQHLKGRREVIHSADSHCAQLCTKHNVCSPGSAAPGSGTSYRWVEVSTVTGQEPLLHRSQLQACTLLVCAVVRHPDLCLLADGSRRFKIDQPRQQPSTASTIFRPPSCDDFPSTELLSSFVHMSWTYVTPAAQGKLQSARVSNGQDSVHADSSTH